MKTLFVIIFLLAGGKMQFGVKTFESTEACSTHLNAVMADSKTPEAEAFAKERGIENIVAFCTTKLREVPAGAVEARQ